MTPVDPYAFVGGPQLWQPEADEVHVSVTFTWDLPEGERLAALWEVYYPGKVRLGGPALNSFAGCFTPGLYVKEGVTFTSRGCPNRCPWCLVPEREGLLRMLPIQPGWIVQDNNLLACPREHQLQVYRMLRAQRCRPVFSGGLQADRVDEWGAEQLRGLYKDRGIGEVYLACDTKGALTSLREAVARLSFLNRRQLRCYVLIGRDETVSTALERLEAVWQAGCLPFAQLYQPAEKRIAYDHEWQALARTWSRPAAMFAMHPRE